MCRLNITAAGALQKIKSRDFRAPSLLPGVLFIFSRVFRFSIKNQGMMATYYLEDLALQVAPPATHPAVLASDSRAEPSAGGGRRRASSLDARAVGHRLALVSDLTLKPQYSDESPSEVDHVLASSSGSWSGNWGLRAARQWGLEPSFAPPSSLDKFAPGTDRWPLQTIVESSTNSEYLERKPSDLTSSRAGGMSSVRASSTVSAASPATSGGYSGGNRIVLSGNNAGGTGGAGGAAPGAGGSSRRRAFASPLEEIAAGVNG